ncbi:hypothetical protein PIB30_055668 [Stylosanthes scabra]|uniref:Uncharacterized protein n=1 Tax=Stylosanthes scabra TaxID=79078 RepID=A0ABU6YHC8_9FABA|nr:hypothetical protein [Stylosanthes scabra]
MEESRPPEPFKGSNATEKLKGKKFGTLFQREAKKGHGGGGEADQIAGKSVKKQWGYSSIASSLSQKRPLRFQGNASIGNNPISVSVA